MEIVRRYLKPDIDLEAARSGDPDRRVLRWVAEVELWDGDIRRRTFDTRREAIKWARAPEKDPYWGMENFLQ